MSWLPLTASSVAKNAPVSTPLRIGDGWSVMVRSCSLSLMVEVTAPTMANRSSRPSGVAAGRRGRGGEARKRRGRDERDPGGRARPHHEGSHRRRRQRGLPLALGYVPFALVVGAALAEQGGGAAGWAGSWLVYGGSAQLAALRSLDSAGAAVALLTGLVVMPGWSCTRPRWADVARPAPVVPGRGVVARDRPQLGRDGGPPPRRPATSAASSWRSGSCSASFGSAASPSGRRGARLHLAAWTSWRRSASSPSSHLGWRGATAHGDRGRGVRRRGDRERLPAGTGIAALASGVAAGELASRRERAARHERRPARRRAGLGSVLLGRRRCSPARPRPAVDRLLDRAGASALAALVASDVAGAGSVGSVAMAAALALGLIVARRGTSMLTVIATGSRSSPDRRRRCRR